MWRTEISIYSNYAEVHYSFSHLICLGSLHVIKTAIKINLLAF